MEITITISLGVEIGVGIEMVIGGENITIRIRVAFMFNLETVMLVQEI